MENNHIIVSTEWHNIDEVRQVVVDALNASKLKCYVSEPLSDEHVMEEINEELNRDGED